MADVSMLAPIIISLDGEFDIYRSEELRRMLKPALDQPRVVVDLTGVRYMDSTALTQFIRMHKARMVNGLEPARLVGLSENLRKILRITALDELWPIFATVQQALDSFGSY